jgi:hypothetical protein
VYSAVAEGRPSKLLRTFDALSQNMDFEISVPMDGGTPPQFDSTSALEGKTVAFTWNAEKGDYDIAFAGGEGDNDLLERLTEDMDLRVFLPAKEVAADDTWDVPLGSLKNLFSPGGDLKLRPEGMEIDEEQVQFFEDMFAGFGEDLEGPLRGRVQVHLRGQPRGGRLEGGRGHRRHGGGRHCGSLGDDPEGARGSRRADGRGDPAHLDRHRRPEHRLRGTGTLLWDLEAGRMHSFTVQGDVTIGVRRRRRHGDRR